MKKKKILFRKDNKKQDPGSLIRILRFKTAGGLCLKHITVEFLCELWIAREKLSSHYHRDDGANAPSWNSYCDDLVFGSPVTHYGSLHCYEPSYIGSHLACGLLAGKRHYGEYCLERWGWTQQRVGQLISSATFVEKNEKIFSVLPTRESYCDDIGPGSPVVRIHHASVEHHTHGVYRKPRTAVQPWNGAYRYLYSCWDLLLLVLAFLQ